MNKKLVIAMAVAAVAASTSALAGVNKQGLYVGGSAGVSRADDGNFFKDETEAAGKLLGSYEWKQGGFGWSAFAGWNFNRNFAVEAGYMQFAKNNYKTPNFDIDHKTSAWDLVGKASLPIAESNWDVYAKAGVAYQTTKYSSAAIQGDSKSDKAFRPVAGVGAGYNFDNGFGVDLSWSRVFGGGTTKAHSGLLELGQPNSDLIALSVTYNIQAWA